MTRLSLSFAFSLLFLIAPFTAVADCPAPTPHLYVGLTDDGYLMGDCIINLSGPTVVSVVVQTVATPKGKVRLKLVDPPAGVLILNETWLPHTGTRQTGMEIDLACSTQPSFALGSFTLFPTATITCSEWKITDVEVEDCDGNPVLMVARPSVIGTAGYCAPACSFQDCMGLGPYNLYPPDGATGVPLNVELTWADGSETPGPYDYCHIRIGTTPDCSDAQWIAVSCEGDHGIVLDFLEPMTTYYWQAQWFYDGGGCSYGNWGDSVVQSFTTGGTIAVEATTWGRVKAMYRD